MASTSCKPSCKTQTNRWISSLPLRIQLPEPFLVSNRKSPSGPGSGDPSTSTATMFVHGLMVPIAEHLHVPGTGLIPSIEWALWLADLWALW